MTERQLFVRGSAWTMADYAAQQLLRLVSNTVLWWLLFPAAFGLMTLVNVLLTGLQMFSDVGIRPSIVQNERGDDPDFLNTAWTIQVIRGGILFLTAWAIAFPVARFYGQPQLAYLVMLVSVNPMIQGFYSTNIASAARHMALGRLARLDLTANFLGITVMITVAYITRSVWALAIGEICSSLLQLYMGHRVLPGIHNRFRWDTSAVKSLAHFGRWIFLSTLITFLAMNADRLVFGKVLSMSQLGVYNIALVWASLPAAVLTRVFARVAFPMLSKARNNGDAIGPLFRRSRGAVLFAGAWLTTCLVAGAQSVVRTLYGTRADDAIWIIPLLAAGAWFAAIEHTNSTAAMTMGRPKWLAAANAAKVTSMAAFVPLGFVVGGFRGAIVGFVVSDFLKYVVSVAAAIKVGVPEWRQDVLVTGEIVVVVAGILGVRYLIPTLPPVIEALLIGGLSTVAWVLLWRWRPDRLGGAQAQLQAVDVVPC